MKIRKWSQPYRITMPIPANIYVRVCVSWRLCVFCRWDKSDKDRKISHIKDEVVCKT